MGYCRGRYIAPQRARDSLARVGWPSEQFAAASLAAAAKNGTTFITDDAQATIASDAVEIVIDATGSPAAGIRHALACCEYGKHIIIANVEADALAGPLLARRAREAGAGKAQALNTPVERDGGRTRSGAHCACRVSGQPA